MNSESEQRDSDKVICRLQDELKQEESDAVRREHAESWFRK